ncbi:MAG: hypothetical protein K0S61_1092 [Anaerocolumna sp.]|nr:hypothetical protein [Anaerocolumna sp.]
MKEKVIMLGNEAFARGAYEAGVKVSAAYPGTPSTEISESIVKYGDIYTEWSPNEKVALEVAIGASMIGVRALASMKHVGLNVASDPLFTQSYIGASGGLVIIVADDPGLYSSQNEQDTRAVARAAKVPVLEPSDSNEAKQFVKFAFELSEKYDTPVIIRSTTRLSHSQGIVELDARMEVEDKPYIKNFTKNVMIPSNAMKRHPLVIQREITLSKDGCDFFINKLEYNDLSIGVITSGIAYQYVKEALPHASILKLGIVNPLPKKLIEDFASKVNTVYIVEELDPIIEEQVKSWGIQVIGKEIFCAHGEYNANMLREVISGEQLNLTKQSQVPNRPPILCPGCPHRSVFSVLNKLKLHAAGDIGCYTLGAIAPLNVIDSSVCMGASISMLHGMEKAKGKAYIKNWVAVIGDSTFLHTGVNSLMNMVYNQGSGTIIILDNSTTGMTGHQDNPATGKTLTGNPAYAIDILKLCKALGVKYVEAINAFDIQKLFQVIKEACASDELWVIVAKAPCALLNKKRVIPRYIVQNQDCIKCGSCRIPGCPAISKMPDGSIYINNVICNGCGLCFSYCKSKAIEKEEVS